MSCFTSCPPCAGCEELRGRLADAERERDEARARADAFTAMTLKRANIEANESGFTAGLTIGTTPEARDAFAVMVAGILDADPRAVNYMAIGVAHRDGREYEVVCQRVEGLTPAQKVAAVERDRAAWERVARQLYREYADYAADGDADVTPLEWFVERYGKGGETNG